MAKKKRKNAVARYFTPFGLRQLCDITLAVSAILMIIGLALYKNTTHVVLIIALFLFLAGALLAAYRSSRILMSGLNKRSPEYKSALVNTIIMAVLAAFAVLGLVAVFVGF